MEVPLENGSRAEFASEGAVLSYERGGPSTAALARRAQTAALVLDPHDPNALELALHEALRTAGLQQQRVAVFFVPMASTAPAWSDSGERARADTLGAGLVIDQLAHQVFLEGKVVHLTAREFSLVRYGDRERQPCL